MEDLSGFLNQSLLLSGEHAGQFDGESLEFCKINTSLLLRMSPLQVSVFIRLSPEHYVKLFQEGDVFDKGDLQRYMKQKNVLYMHVLRSEVDHVAKDLMVRLVEIIESTDASPSDMNDILEEAVATSIDLIQQIGVTEEVQEMVEQSVNLSIKSMGDFPKLQGVLKSFDQKSDRYIPSHSMLLAKFACSIAVEMDWYSETTFEKLTYAAILHDVTMKDDDLCKVKSMSEFDSTYKGKFSREEIKAFADHPK